MHPRVGSALDDTTLRRPGEWVRVRPWRGRPNIAALSISTERPPTPELVDECLDHLRSCGCHRVITSALAPPDAVAFLDAGFSIRERLHLLTHDMAEVDQPPRRTRRARGGDRAAVLALDHHAFDEEWRFDAAGLDDAIRATPVARFRVAGDRPPAAYAISGRAGRHGYLQRLAVSPEERRQGWGRTMVNDGLRWLRRHGVTATFVNTQLDNTAGLELYAACGFHRQAVGLSVLGRTL